jgi:5-oxoprolinase (ATP-hydrolysing)
VLLAPALAIESVAAGGGSVCGWTGHGLRVGPESAGARPGPACYGAGGPLTITDVNLLLGRLDPARFGIPIAPGAAAGRLEALRAALEAATGEAVGAEPLLEGLLDIANERMADAIRGISLRKGYDPAEYALVAFGGAGAQHACGVAERLGVTTVVVPADAGLLSALGLGHALLERFAERQVLRPLDEAGSLVRRWVMELAASATGAVAREGVEVGEIVVRRRIANLRYQGQESTLAVEFEDEAALGAAFEERYRSVYGHRPEARPIELESLRVIASSRPRAEERPATPAPRTVEPERTARAWARAAGDSPSGGWAETAVFERERLRPGDRFAGPALVFERHSAATVEAGWEGTLDGAGALVLTRGKREEGRGKSNNGPEPDRQDSAVSPPSWRGDAEGEGAGYGQGAAPTHSSLFPLPSSLPPKAVLEELFTSRFQALVGEMGDQLQRTALSTNVKERLDFSCAVLDRDGELVVNAPHIPVHLGALGECVRRVREAVALRPGDVVVTNHPAFGGSHLPDITVVTPVFGALDEPIGYVANRAHHAEIGGSRPGSMPPDATSLAEEGVVIAPRYLVERGEGRWAELRTLLTGGPYPTRAVEDNLADLRAQVAANHRGATLLRALAAAHGVETIARHMGALQQRAERRIREALGRLRQGRYEAEERLDDGSPLRVRIEIRGGRATVDFAGSAPVHPGNLNATPAIVRSAVLYVLRLLVDEPLPLNEGLLRAVELRVPPGLLSPPWGVDGGGTGDPAGAPAVVGGNTEVSQRLVDTLLKAFGLVACSQGTMNNVLWGNDRFGYYETVCGGSGAGPGWDGESAVHSHMTNTRITDPEVVEHRYPVRVERFAVRAGSGGVGRWRGGDGVVRELSFQEPMSLSVLTQHRAEGPYGLEGGAAGAPGRQRVVRAGGEVVELASVDGCEVGPGDRLVLETPGGGGYGSAP